MKNTLPVRSVVSLFFDMTGEYDTEKWIDFCKASCNIILTSLRDDADIAANESSLCYAAACHAFYMYVLRGCASGIASFKAVDISINTVSDLTLSAAKTVFEGAMANIAPLLKSTRFAFKSV